MAITGPADSADLRVSLIQDLVDFFLSEKIEIHGVKGSMAFPSPPYIKNEGFNDLEPRQPDVIGFDPVAHRIVFGLVRVNARALASEQSLAEYNVFLDHNARLGPRASLVYVLIPEALLHEFTGIITHYIHREYWTRIIPVPSRRLPLSEEHPLTI
jgi:hypothetical protein